MHPEVSEQLLRLQRHAELLGQEARRIAAATPHRSEGTDSTGCVKVVLGPDGVPAEARIADRWQRLREPDTLASAVLEANGDALRQAVTSWTATLTDTRPAGGPGASGMDAAAVSPHGRAGEPTELAERAINSLRDVQRTPTGNPAAHTGSDTGQHVAIVLGPSGDLVECVIDPRWATGRDGATITAALSTALRHARSRLAATPSTRNQLDALLGDALATLSALTSQPPHEVEDR